MIYLTPSALEYADDLAFKVSLTLHDRVIVPFEVNQLGWDSLDFAITTGENGVPKRVFPRHARTRQSPTARALRQDHWALKRRIRHDPRVMRMLRSRINGHDAISRYRTFREHIRDLEAQIAPGRNERLLLSAELFMTLTSSFEEEIGQTLTWEQESDLLAMTQECIHAAYLMKRCAIPSIMPLGAQDRLERFRRQASFNLWRKGTWGSSYLRRELGVYTSRGLARLLCGKRGMEYHFAEIMLPDLTTIPILELAKFLEKDKAKPIVEYLKGITERYRDALSREDLLYECMNQYRQLANLICPGLGDVAIGVLGNVPTPVIVNPVGVYGSIAQALRKHQIGRRFPMLLAVAALQKKARKKTMKSHGESSVGNA